jgi:pimeloyl-ACP methyl ester carboxylesterase
MISTDRITVQGLITSVLVGGEGRPGEAVLFVHGNPDAGSDWMPLLTRVGRYARVIAPDLPGFGAADERPAGDYSVDTYARFVQGVVEHYGLTRVHIVGHDFGGPFAASWVADHPGAAASLTFLNTGVLVGYRWHRMARIWRTPLLGELSMRALNPRLAAAALARENPGLPPQWVQIISGHLLPPKTRRAVLRLYRSARSGDMDALAARLREADLDALVVFGDADAYLPADLASRQVEVFPRAQVHVLPGVGHWCWLEQPDLVAGHLAGFLRERLG